MNPRQEQREEGISPSRCQSGFSRKGKEKMLAISLAFIQITVEAGVGDKLSYLSTGTGFCPDG